MNNFYRIIDANTNRISEGLRTLEDYFRFVSPDRELNKALRNLRHEIRDSLKEFDGMMISSRESLNDNGLGLSQSSDIDGRSSGNEFITANFKRVEEALRSLEENLKIICKNERSKIIERIRFSVYELEKLAFSKLKRNIPAGLYGITAEEFSKGRSNLHIAKEMISAGINIIQYREKEENKSRKIMLDECLEIRKITRDAGVLFIVNDYLDIALLSDADGIHCGQNDLSVSNIRQLSSGLIIGISTETPEQMEKAVKDGADYIGIGPVFQTNTKKDASEPVGLGHLKYAAEKIKIPFVAIGGIKEHNLRKVLDAGAVTAAIITDITEAENIRAKISALNAIIADFNKLKDK
ncbi:MAG: thiamine phosphate synthase [Candidatus Delongbacteria bacterium]